MTTIQAPAPAALVAELGSPPLVGLLAALATSALVRLAPRRGR